MFNESNIKSYAPDGVPLTQALARTTHLAIAAHPDDIEIIGFHGINHCFQNPQRWFTGIVVTDGAGSPRSGRINDHNDAELVAIRAGEQRRAAQIGRYSLVIQLGYSSSEVKGKINRALVEGLIQRLEIARPATVYLHNPADRHDTHIGVSLHALEALRALPEALRPERVFGIEVWRSLDWLPDAYRVSLDVGGNPELFSKLINVFKSQISNGKQYDAALSGRLTANATFNQSHVIDQTPALSLAIDLTELVRNENIGYHDFMKSTLDSFTSDVLAQIDKY